MKINNHKKISLRFNKTILSKLELHGKNENEDDER
jgi:hypothetical protein